MQIGPTLVYNCPNCGNLLSKGSLRSGNHIGVKLYSDLKKVAPMLPDFPNLTKCKKCNKFFYLDHYDEIGKFEIDDETVDPAWLDADKAEFLSIDDYFVALIEFKYATNFYNELFIRNRIVWAYNDRIRAGQKMFEDENDEQRWNENLRSLMSMLTESDLNEKILLAEIKRYLGDFEGCMALINSIDSSKMTSLKEIFRNECEKMNRYVVQIQ